MVGDEMSYEFGGHLGGPSDDRVGLDRLVRRHVDVVRMAGGGSGLPCRVRQPGESGR